MGCAAEIIALDDVRAIQQRQAFRQQLHERFDQWLDEVEARLPAATPTLAQVSETIWSLRQGLTAAVPQTITGQAHQEERNRKSLRCTTCDRLVSARPSVSRTVRTLVGDLEIERPYFYCRSCRVGTSPLDTVLGLSAGQMQLDVQQVAADLATEMPYETASAMLERLSGIAVSSERVHTLMNHVAEGLSVLDVAPSRAEIDQRVAQVAAGRFRRPVLVLGIDGAYVPSRPESARGRRPGQARFRARRAHWRHAWYEAKGFRFYLLDGDRIVHVLSWHQSVFKKVGIGSLCRDSIAVCQRENPTQPISRRPHGRYSNHGFLPPNPAGDRKSTPNGRWSMRCSLSSGPAVPGGLSPTICPRGASSIITFGGGLARDSRRGLRHACGTVCTCLQTRSAYAASTTRGCIITLEAEDGRSLKMLRRKSPGGLASGGPRCAGC